MKQKKTKKEIYKNNIEIFIKKLSILFGLATYEIQFLYKEKHNEGAWATCSKDESYQRIVITIYTSLLKETDNTIKKTLLHELLHTITYEVSIHAYLLIAGKHITKRELELEDEKAVSKLENIFHKLFTSKQMYDEVARIYNDSKIK